MKINPGNARGLLVPQGDRPFSFVVYSSEIRDFGFLGAGLPVQKPISIELTKESLSQLMQISPERVHISSDLIERLLEVFPFDIFPKK